MFIIIFPYRLTPARDAGSHGWMIETSIAYYQYLRTTCCSEGLVAGRCDIIVNSYMRYHT